MIDIIKSRTSYRGRYKNIPISRSDLISILEAGVAAPSGCNKQTTSFIAVDDPVILQQVKQCIHPPVCESAPALIVVLTQKIYAYREKCYNVQDYSAAIENMLLAIHAFGYESCWYEGHITDDDHIDERIAKVLHVPSTYQVVCILPVGIAIDNVIKTEKNFHKRVSFNMFDK